MRLIFHGMLKSSFLASGLGMCLSLSACTPNMIGSPELAVTPRPGFLARTDLRISAVDQRRDTTNSAALLTSINDALAKAYPDAKVQALPAEYFADARLGGVTVKVALVDHAMGFGIEAAAGVGMVNGAPVVGLLPAGVWNGLTVLQVTVFDGRGAELTKTASTIYKVASKSNTWGVRSGLAAQRESFTLTVNDLLRYLDTSLLR